MSRRRRRIAGRRARSRRVARRSSPTPASTATRDAGRLLPAAGRRPRRPPDPRRPRPGRPHVTSSRPRRLRRPLQRRARRRPCSTPSPTTSRSRSRTDGYRPSSWRSTVNAEPLPAIELDRHRHRHRRGGRTMMPRSTTPGSARARSSSARRSRVQTPSGGRPPDAVRRLRGRDADASPSPTRRRESPDLLGARTSTRSRTSRRPAGLVNYLMDNALAEVALRVDAAHRGRRRSTPGRCRSSRWRSAATSPSRS